MDLSMDLSVRALYGAGLAAPSGVSSRSDGGFSQVYAAAYQNSAGLEGCFQLAAETYQVPEDLLKAVAKVESDFTADAVSSCGAQGIMQLMPATARYLGVTDSFDPAQNIMGGAKYLRQMLDRFDGDVSMALAAYNAGPGAVEKSGGVPRFAQNYVNKVLGYAGDGLTLPAAADSPASAGSLTTDELAELILQVSYSGSTDNQASIRLLVEQLFQKKGLENEEENPLRPALI